MKTQKKKKKTIKPFALKCPVCNGKGEVRVHLFLDDPLDNMTTIPCHACKGRGYIVHYGAELTIYPSNLTINKKKNKTIAEISIPTATDINDCNNCIYACPTLNSHPSSRYCLLKHKEFPAIYICSDWSCKTND